jgi:hypothetical protein
MLKQKKTKPPEYPKETNWSLPRAPVCLAPSRIPAYAPVSDTQVQEVGSRLAKAIMSHFEAGESDPEVLKTIAVNSVRRESRHLPSTTR